MKTERTSKYGNKYIFEEDKILRIEFVDGSVLVFQEEKVKK